METSTIPSWLWKAKEAKVSYNLWHPLSISIIISGEQMICTSTSQENCYQIHGQPWHLYFPIYKPISGNNIDIFCSDFFYNNNHTNFLNLRTIHVKKLRATLGWDINTPSTLNHKILFASLNAQKTSISIMTNQVQLLEHIHTKIAFIDRDKTIKNDSNTKILIQQLQVRWQSLSINLTGQIHLSKPNFSPTGELFLQMNGLPRTIHHEIQKLACCKKLKENILQLHVPEQITLPLSIRGQDIYIGAIPLNNILNQNLLTSIKQIFKSIRTDP